MLTRRVLVQWLQSESLRNRRFLEEGAAVTSEIQQLGIEAYDPEFPAALVLSGPRIDGQPQLQVGFKAPTRYAETWQFVGGSHLGAPFHHFDTVPTKADLIAMALEAAGGLTPELEARIEAQRVSLAEVLEAHQERSEAETAAYFERTAKDPDTFPSEFFPDWLTQPDR